MKSVVLVTAIGTAASTSIITQLRKAGSYYILGADIYQKNQIATSRDVDQFYTFPSAIRNMEEYIDFVVDFCREHNVNYYFATIDEEIANLSANRAKFEEIGVKLCIPDDRTVSTCHYKNRFFNWVAENMPEIATRTYEHFSDVEQYPVFIKPVEGRASIGCRKVASSTEAEQLLRDGLDEKDYVIQDFNEGEIITVDLVRNACTGQKQQIQRIEYLRNSSGCGIAVEIVDLPGLHAICDKLVDKLDLNGVVNAEFFHMGDSYRIIEVNPRFSAGTSFSCLAGCNTVINAVQIASREPCTFNEPAVGAHMAKRYETIRID